MSARELSVKEVAELLNLEEAKLRYWAQTGLVGPSVRQGGRFLYGLADLVAVRVARDLSARGVGLAAMRKQLEALRALMAQSLQSGRALDELKILSDGDTLVVAPAGAGLEAASALVAFEVTEIAGAGEPLAELGGERRGPKDAPSAYARFLEGTKAHDMGDVVGAETHYRAAIALDAALAAAWTNLALVLERRGAVEEARAACEKALALDPDQPEARYNLASLLADANENLLAAAELRRVVALAPDFADAHFNLALVCKRLGDHADARLHVERYLALAPSGEWAVKAQALVQD